jgi:hypothetical protein
MFIRSFFTAAFIAALMLSGLQPARAQASETQSITGWLSIIWGDGQQGSESAGPLYFVTDETGATTRLDLGGDTSLPEGGLLTLNRQRVTVSGTAAQPEVLQAGSVAQDPSAQEVGPSAVSGAQPFISIMCKFADYSSEPKDLTYFQGMYGSGLSRPEPLLARGIIQLHQCHGQHGRGLVHSAAAAFLLCV